MALAVNIDKLIKGQVVETDRIEYKSGWNPEDVIHTMCAFANDINNLGGGYMVLGVEEKDGVPQLPPKGLERNQIDSIQKKLLELSNTIQPAYFGISDIAEIEGKSVLVLHCPGGDHRPYSAPVSLSKKRKDRAYWIRRYNSTVRANPDEQQTLHEMAAKVPFDDRINHQASITDLSLSLIKEFLQKVQSPLFEQAETIPFQDLCRQMQIVKGPDEQLKPVNVGLLLLNNKPEQFFPVTQIDVVIYRDEVGDRFSEKIFTGPIHKQLQNALDYINTNVIHEEVVKVQGRAEANRFYNYPYAAIEEVLANAVYHKSYERRNPIEVNVRPDQIEVLSFPGPLPPVDNKMLKQKRIVSREYRNRRIGDFLKELQLTEGRATGFPKIYDAMKRNGSPEPGFETDDDRTYFLAVLPVHPDVASLSNKDNLFFEVDKTSIVLGELRTRLSQVCPKSVSGSGADVILLKLFHEGRQSIGMLMERVSESNRTRFRENHLNPLMECGLVAFTIPDKPTSSKQKYKLTDQGIGLVESAINEIDNL